MFISVISFRVLVMHKTFVTISAMKVFLGFVNCVIIFYDLWSPKVTIKIIVRVFVSGLRSYDIVLTTVFCLLLLRILYVYYGSNFFDPLFR